MPRSPRFAQLCIDLARCGRQELGGFSAGSRQLRVSRRALALRRSRIKRRMRGGGDISGHALDIGLRQLADGAGADQPGLLACLAYELPDDALSRDAEGGDLR